mmetsp:Transcript_10185/g.28395  ORF Transcript_10185/g.28395 Transcript_10185/m.28395 type:complete len:501 (-) Transcript_10185:443-1945(-)
MKSFVPRADRIASTTRLCPAASALCMARPISFLVATGTPMFGVLPMRPRTHSAAPATAARESMAPRDGGCGCRLSSSSTASTSSPANATAMRFDHAVWFLGFVIPTKALSPCVDRVAPSRTGLCGGGSAPYPPCSAQLAQKNAESGIWSTHPECCQTPHRALQHRIMSSLPSSSTHPHSQWTHSNVASVNPGARLTPSISPGCGSASVPGRSSSSSSSSSKNATFSSSNTMKSTPSSSSSSSPRSISASSSARSISRSSASSRPIFSLSSETCSFQISDLRARPTLMRELVRFLPRSALSDVGVLLLTTAGLSIGGVSSSSLLSRMARGLCPGRTRRLGAGDAPPFSFPGESGASSSDSFSSPSSAPPPRPRLFLSFLSRSRLDLADVGSAMTIGWTATGDGGSTSSEEDVPFDADSDAFLSLSLSSSSSWISMASSEVFPAPSPPPPSSSSTSSPPPPPSSSSTSSSSHTKSSISLENSSSSLTRSALTPATFTFGRYS